MAQFEFGGDPIVVSAKSRYYWFFRRQSLSIQVSLLNFRGVSGRYAAECVELDFSHLSQSSWCRSAPIPSRGGRLEALRRTRYPISATKLSAARMG